MVIRTQLCRLLLYVGKSGGNLGMAQNFDKGGTLGFERILKTVLTGKQGKICDSHNSVLFPD